MTTSKEIITLQLGHYSNYIGTHLWNTQEAYFSATEDGGASSEIDHNVMFRTLETRHGESYEPRVVIFDLQGSFGALKKGGEIGEAHNLADTWTGNVETFKQEEHPHNAFIKFQNDYATSVASSSSSSPSQGKQQQQPQHPIPPPSFSDILESSVRVWSDYSKLSYHPKSIVQVPNYTHENPTTPFALYGAGRDVLSDVEFRDEVIDDRIRSFLEDCDSLQGFQVLTDVNNAFGGLTTSIMEALLDDMPKTTFMTFGVSETKDPVVGNLQDYQKRMFENVNQIQCLRYLKDTSSIYIPVSSPLQSELDPNGWSRYLNPKFNLRYHSSAYLASLIETATLPFRTFTNPLYIYEAAPMVSSNQSTKIAAICGSLPLRQIHDDATLRKLLSYNPMPGFKFNWFRDVTLRVGYEQVEHENGSYTVLRGVGCDLQGQARSKIPSMLHQQEALNDFAASFPTFAGQSRSIVVNEGLPISDAFPQLFGSDHIAKQESMLVRIRTPARIKETLQEVIQQLKTLPKRVAMPLERITSGSSMEDMMEIREDLEQTMLVYNEIE
ncbi:hypothetical protein SmJEL517_g02647 [Synchytrium microbalum]|uniref:Tubulin nucleotide-binding domain-like protein n=1 Tax=Synchytrium microbalum TaxID=1806994 RepID=A0A507C9Z9_9FUNG|nr:uncharacterized protein SmJEL517_g02647 [Synchytrium microbalum]TPX34804.1 hypothetical protein SmJEL517_g02647 [Synchytrium microbalum]